LHTSKNYGFAYHQPKLTLLRENPQHRRFAPIADFLERVFDIKCAWFNEEQYCEFFPRALLAQPRGGDAAV
jgi:hypothetical protein